MRCLYGFAWILFVSTTVSAIVHASDVPSVEEYRQELRDLHVLQNYRPMKNSFVLGLEAICGKPMALKKGDRKTVLRAEGVGSLRHIWETHGQGEAPFFVEIFIDGEETPSIRAKLLDLIHAAQKCDQPFVMNPGGVIPKGSHNLYLPIPFGKSIQVDLVLTRDLGMIFMQLDYRLEDESLKGVRLVQRGEGEAMKLAYEGLPKKTRNKVFSFSFSSHASGGLSGSVNRNGVLGMEDLAIVRSLRVDPVDPDATMKIRFDGEPSAAVDVRLADFFGPFEGVAFNGGTCYLPMPFRKEIDIEITGAKGEVKVVVETERVKSWDPQWGYFHAKSAQEKNAVGYVPFQVLYTRGRGHWVGMNLYDTQHDHGGGDFAVADGETSRPSFLHGINGEDYFSFAFFGQGKNFPYSEAFPNEVGRTRVHIENVYPFKESLQVSWGVRPGVSPRGVSFWYQDSPADLTQTAQQAQGLKWQVFGPRPVTTLLEDGNTPDVSDPDKLFAVLPTEAEVDAGASLKVGRFFRESLEGTLTGWVNQPAIGPHLNLMYIYHHSDMGGDSHMGYDARAMMARTTLTSPANQDVTFELSYDDPLIVSLNGKEVHRDMMLREGFTTQRFKGPLNKGDNRLLIRMIDTPNHNTCWAGISLRVVDGKRREISSQRR